MEEPPHHILDAARRVPSMRVPDSVVADITYDSALDESADHEADRKLIYSCNDVVVTVVVRRHDHELELAVRVDPPGVAKSVRCVGHDEVVCVLGTGVTSLRVKQGLTSLLVMPTAPGAAPVQTAWVPL